MVNWQELIISLKRATGLPVTKISKEIGVSHTMLNELHSGRHRGNLTFDNGIILFMYAKEVGADLTRVIKRG